MCGHKHIETERKLILLNRLIEWKRESMSSICSLIYGWKTQCIRWLDIASLLRYKFKPGIFFLKMKIVWVSQYRLKSSVLVSLNFLKISNPDIQGQKHFTQRTFIVWSKPLQGKVIVKEKQHSLRGSRGRQNFLFIAIKWPFYAFKWIDLGRTWGTCM